MGGYHLFFSVHRHEIKKEIHAYLDANPGTGLGTYLSFRLVNHQVEQDSFEWKDKKKEFLFQGEMFDVISVKESGDSIRIYALKDTREMDLEKQIAKINQSKHDKNETPYTAVLKFFSVFYFENTHSQYTPGFVTVNYQEMPSNGYFPPVTDIIIPPPRG